MNRKKVVILILVLLTVVGLWYGLRNLAAPHPAQGEAWSGYDGVIGVIHIEGTILGGGGGGGLLALPGADAVLEQLRAAQRDPEIAAVILRINSPGGSAAASQEIHREVMRLREAGLPVFASLGDVAASGGYWIASAADVIVANAATITGSIGVIMQVTNLEELYEKLGMDFETIKSGEHKDIGSPSREMTSREREILQHMVDDIFEQFVEVVAEGRNMEMAEVRALADGRVFTGRQAIELGLVDEEGNFYDAVDLVREFLDIEGEVRLKRFEQNIFPWQMFLSQSTFPAEFFSPWWLLKENIPSWRQ